VLTRLAILNIMLRYGTKDDVMEILCYCTVPMSMLLNIMKYYTTIMTSGGGTMGAKGGRDPPHVL